MTSGHHESRIHQRSYGPCSGSNKTIKHENYSYAYLSNLTGSKKSSPSFIRAYEIELQSSMTIGGCMKWKRKSKLKTG
jgi:hypothetical protein